MRVVDPRAEDTSHDRRGDDSDAVDLVTFHAAKGLEWPIVHVAGLEQGLVPIAHARTPESVDEERRLLYVALTRAQRRLECSWATARSFADGPATSRQPSRWLAPLQRTITELDEPPADNWRQHLREGRAHLVR
jgi:DNA helicase-2/ATP-dependent DNA helicase PcrA